MRKTVIRLDTKTGRDALRKQYTEGSPNPFFWQKLSTGRALGLRLNKVGESWIARYRDGDGRHEAEDDRQRAEGIEQDRAEVRPPRPVTFGGKSGASTPDP